MGRSRVKPVPSATPLSPAVYSREYFLHCRQGADEFVESGGRKLSPIHQKILSLAEPGPGKKILDIGCGCGELVIHAALAGAEATGIDFAPAAHELAVTAARTIGVKARFLLGDVADLPDEKFDVVILADVVEHLHHGQLLNLYRGIHSRLNTAGRLIIHTWPNRWHTEYTYPLVRLLLALFGVRKPLRPRRPHDEVMHVNEQSLLSLRQDLRDSGFLPQIWLEHPAENATLFYRLIHNLPGVRIFFADHLFVVAKINARTGPATAQDGQSQ